MTQAVKDQVQTQLAEQATNTAEVATTSTQQTATEATPTSPELPTVTPHHEVYSNNNINYLRVYMPGISPEQLSVEIEGNKLTVQGKMTAPDLKGYAMSWSEFNFKNYKITFKLASDIDLEAIEANMDAGLLRLKLPRKADSRRTIKVS